MDVAAVYDDVTALLEAERPDFVDIVAGPEAHASLVHLAARHRVPVICQKPLASSYFEAEGMVRVCAGAGVPLLVHENWRWQAPIRRLKKHLADGDIGRPFRARLSFVTSFPVFDNQPSLREAERFILLDVGSHILDTVRFLFGEARVLACRTQRVHTGIRGEDVATVLLVADEDVTVICEMSYASRTEMERFPQTFVFIEGDRGSLDLAADYWVRLTTRDGTSTVRVPPPRYPWADPLYEVVHASIVPCNANLLAALGGLEQAETTGADNLMTLRLVFDAYEMA
jgi:predicted dehydrogenase